MTERDGLIPIPFLLEGVAGERELNQADGIHPTAAGQRLVAETVRGGVKVWVMGRRGRRTARGRADLACVLRGVLILLGLLTL